MSIKFHVNGAATILLGQGDDGKVDTLGWSESGVDLTFSLAFTDVHADVYSLKTPVDVQYMLQSVFISFKLVFYENDVFDLGLGQMWRLATQPGFAPGIVGPAGDLVIQNPLNAYRLVIQSTPIGDGITDDEACYNFPQAYPLSIRGVHGSIRKEYDCIWRAIPVKPNKNYSNGSASGALVWDDNCDTA